MIAKHEGTGSLATRGDTGPGSVLQDSQIGNRKNSEDGEKVLEDAPFNRRDGKSSCWNVDLKGWTGGW